MHFNRQFREELGFVPTAAVAHHLERNNYHILTLNGQEAGYVMHGGGFQTAYRLIQVAVSEEAWLQGHGEALINTALARARTRPHREMTCSVRAGLPMNDVAPKTGANHIYTTNPKTTRKKPLLHYQWPNGLLPRPR